VRQGTVLALDPSSFSVPLLSPCSGTAHLKQNPDHIIVKRNASLEQEPDRADFIFPSASNSADPKAKMRYSLFRQGAWHFLRDVYTTRLPDPAGAPQAIIVSTVNLEPFTARGDVQIRNDLASFTRGLEHLQALLEYQPIYLIFPKVNSEFAHQVRNSLRGFAWIRLIEASTVYPADDFALTARSLGLRPSVEKGSVWGLRAEGVIAFDSVISANDSITSRVIALGGPGVPQPTHIEVPIGFPIASIRELCGIAASNRLISGGVFSGTSIDAQQLGVDAECSGITVLPEPEAREFLSFVRPCFSKRSYSRAFASAIRPRFFERFTTALRGENRACVSCGYCTEVCPARIVPTAIHKLLYQNNIDEVEAFLPDRCIGCGLCSYVCPSKIELASEIVGIRDKIWMEQSLGKAGQ
jgi:Na+-transporting NADH:ubiquinone oxidoreductase subunit A